MEEKMMYRKFMKWVLALSCLLLINSMVLAVEAGKEKSKELININTASAEELVQIPGVGQALAKRIIAFREKHGSFEKLEDLMKVRGIGEKNFKKMMDSITVGKKSKKKS
jgi:comEA protein